MTDVMAAAEETVPSFMVTEAMFDARDWSRGQRPVYRVDEMAKFFFGMSASWLRLKLKADKEHPETWFVVRGKRMDFRRNDPDKGDSARVFILADVEPMAWSLFTFGAIDYIRLAQILRIVQAQAILYGLLDVPDDGNGESAVPATGDEG
jgi:hypothetical protein